MEFEFNNTKVSWHKFNNYWGNWWLIAFNFISSYINVENFGYTQPNASDNVYEGEINFLYFV